MIISLLVLLKVLPKEFKQKRKELKELKRDIKRYEKERRFLQEWYDGAINLTGAVAISNTLRRVTNHIEWLNQAYEKKKENIKS